jgi:hypothetical protein
MNARLQLKEKFGQWIAYVKVDELFDWKQVAIPTVDYQGKPTGQISLWATQDEARNAARKFAQQEINKTARIAA